MSSFERFALGEAAQRALAERGIATPTPIQERSLPLSLEGRDVLGRARTGTGKTLAFALPIAARLEPSRERGRAPRALVLAPVRELARQVAGELAWIASGLETVAVYGGTGYGAQAAALSRGVDVVVATPGRAADYLRRGMLDLSAVQIVVLDEADEMLSMGFEEEVELLLGATPKERQTLLFSATMPRWAERLASEFQDDPERIDVVGEEEIAYREMVIEADPRVREDVLSDVLHVHGGAGAIVFTRTKAEVDGLAANLAARGHRTEAVHGDLDQKARERALARFRRDGATVLVGTEVAARGLDLPEVDLVVHFRLPGDPEIYQHRSGRTGRAGRGGTVVTFASPRERRELGRLEHALRRRLERVAAPRPEEVRAARLSALEASMERISGRDLDAWRDVAERIVAEGDADAVAGLLARALGGLPEPRSLLTGQEGWTTVTVRGPQGGIGPTGAVVRILKDAGAGEVGRVVATRDGGWADVRPDAAEGLPKAIANLDDSLTVGVADAPPVEEPRPGRGGPRRSGPRRGPRRDGPGRSGPRAADRRG